LFFWKEAWLKPVAATSEPSPELTPSLPAEDAECLPRGDACSDQNVWSATRSNQYAAGGEFRYFCQATELPRYTTRLRWWNPLQYLEDYRAGNVTLARLISGLAYAGYAYSAHPRLKPFAHTLHWLYDRFQAAIGGVPFPRRYGTIPKGQATPSSELGLRSGELVRVKSYAKILSTLDTNNKNAGLFFDAEMVPFCGRIFRVRDRVHRFIDEKSGKMTSLKTPAVILDKVWCQSRYSSCRVFCPRSIFSWWREVWLERVAEGEHELRELPALDADTGGKAAIRLQPAARAVRSQL